MLARQIHAEQSSLVMLYSKFLFKGDATTQSIPEDSTPLQDINISTYLTSGPLPHASISRVESDEPKNPDDEQSESRVLVSLEPSITASFDSLPRHLFVNTDGSTFCQSNTDDERKVYCGNSAPLMDVLLPEVIHTEGEETVICSEDIEEIEHTTETSDSSEEENSPKLKYVKLCV